MIPEHVLEAAKAFIGAFGVGVTIVPHREPPDYALLVERIPPAFFETGMPTSGWWGGSPLSCDRIYFNYVPLVERQRYASPRRTT